MTTKPQTVTSPPASATVPRVRALAPLRAALGDRRGRWGIVLTLTIIAVAAFGPLLAPYQPSAFVGKPFAPPSAVAPFGTDLLGRDVLSRVLWGGRSVVWMSFAATTLGVGVGVAIGLAAGYLRGLWDEVLMRPLDILMAFPQLVLVLLFVSMLGPMPILIVCLVAVAWVPSVARITRSIAMEIAAKDFVASAEVLGVSRLRIMFSEILPNLATPLLVEYGLRLTWSIGLIAGLSFLGFGIQPPAADWGLMINENRNALVLQPWSVIMPVFCVAFFTIGTNMIAEGISRTIAGIDRTGGAR